jgi:sugar fermentation stimulation protein A
MQTYILKIYLDKAKHIQIGKLGTFSFARGVYWYVGSAKRNLNARIARHRRKEKKLHWHIDYLLQHATIAEVWSTEACEGRTAALLAGILTVPAIGFGASDKKTKAHLFYGAQPDLFDSISRQARIERLAS